MRSYMSEFKKYDSDDVYINYSARLTKDPEVRVVGNKELVRLTFVSTSRAEGDEDMWIEATPQDSQMEIAKFLRHKDVLPIEGKPTLRKYGENKEKHAYNLRRTKLHINVELLMRCKERGYVPVKEGDTPRPANTRPSQRKVMNLDDE